MVILMSTIHKLNLSDHTIKRIDSLVTRRTEYMMVAPDCMLATNATSNYTKMRAH